MPGRFAGAIPNLKLGTLLQMNTHYCCSMFLNDRNQSSYLHLSPRLNFCFLSYDVEHQYKSLDKFRGSKRG
ncbi:MAG: hypothetical protein C0507_19645 [Cyanobacteria bacterium PR.3.49]|nr:hypothetical protein [Cyanobacteria bacterium PR.3.49]